MKLIFLDMDGVMNNSSTPYSPNNNINEKEWWLHQIEPELVSRLNRVIEETGAHVIISSSWRMYWYFWEMQELLEEKGFKGKIIGRTPLYEELEPELVGDKIGLKMSRHYPRGLEILQWLVQSRKGEEDKIVIFDDCEDMVSLSDRYIQTSMKTGLTEEDADRAIEMLNE